MGQTPVQVEEMTSDVRLDVSGHRAGFEPGRAGKRPGPGVDLADPELRAKALEHLERDAPVGRELSSGDVEHPTGTAAEDRLASRARALALTGRKNAQTRVRGAYAIGCDERGVECHRRLGENLLDVGGGDGDVAGIAVVRCVRRAQEEHAGPGHREGDPHVVLSDRERRRPSLLGRDQDVGALAQSHGCSCPRILEATDVVDPGAGRVDDHAGVDGDDLVVDAHIGALQATPNRAERDDLGAVRDDGAGVGRRSHVEDAEARVVGGRVRVEGAGSQPLETK